MASVSQEEITAKRKEADGLKDRYHESRKLNPVPIRFLVTNTVVNMQNYVGVVENVCKWWRHEFLVLCHISMRSCNVKFIQYS